MILDALRHLVAPKVCRICGTSLAQGEEAMCLGCYLNMPRTGIHRLDFNPLHQRLGHRHAIDRAAGWFWYKRQSEYARMLVDAKYGSLPGLAHTLGRLCATELAKDHFFDGIDILVPMPLHWRKRLSRGYNQAEEICLGISAVTGIPVINALRAVKPHGVQSRHDRNARFSSIAGTLGLRTPSAVTNRHVLFVDDIVTTGASASEAIATLSQAHPASISILTLGLTQPTN